MGVYMDDDTYRCETWITWLYKIIIVRISMGGVDPRPYGMPLFYCAPINHKSQSPNAGTKSSNCLSVMPAGSYPAMRALK